MGEHAHIMFGGKVVGSGESEKGSFGEVYAYWNYSSAMLGQGAEG